LLQLLVVNHGSAEQVLFYEVQPSPDALTPPTLAWRGSRGDADKYRVNVVQIFAILPTPFTGMTGAAPAPGTR